MKKVEKYIVRSTDKKWYALSYYGFTDKEKYAAKFTKEEADEIISEITVMKLEKIAA